MLGIFTSNTDEHAELGEFNGAGDGEREVAETDAAEHSNRNNGTSVATNESVEYVTSNHTVNTGLIMEEKPGISMGTFFRTELLGPEKLVIGLKRSLKL